MIKKNKEINKKLLVFLLKLSYSSLSNIGHIQNYLYIEGNLKIVVY